MLGSGYCLFKRQDALKQKGAMRSWASVNRIVCEGETSPAILVGDLGLAFVVLIFREEATVQESIFPGSARVLGVVYLPQGFSPQVMTWIFDTTEVEVFWHGSTSQGLSRIEHIIDHDLDSVILFSPHTDTSLDVLHTLFIIRDGHGEVVAVLVDSRLHLGDGDVGDEATGLVTVLDVLLQVQGSVDEVVD